MLKIICAAAFLAGTVACGPRKVEVKTGAQPVAEVSLRVTNNLDQAVNVSVVNGGTDIFLGQVAAKSSQAMNIPGIAAGTTVQLKATPADGSRTYSRNDVTLGGSYEWTVP